MKSRQTSRVEVLVAGRALDALAIRHAPQDFQSELHTARSKFGSALCCCLSSPLPLVIRERNGRLFLAAWPEQSSQHAMGCPFFSETRLENAAENAGAVIREDSGNKVLLHHPLRQPNRVKAPPVAADLPSGPIKIEQGNPSKRFSRLHLWGLIHYLWDEAGLNRWHPGWHRDWGFVRNALRRVAQSTVVDGNPLLTSLYVPPVWNPDKRLDIRTQWAQFTAPLRANHRRSALVASAFVIGSVRTMEQTDFGHALCLHHHAERFFMDDWMVKSLAQYSRRGWSAIKRMDILVDGDEKPYVIAGLRIESSPTGKMIVVEAVLMRVTPRYIPVNSSFEDKLARLLVQMDRQFVRPLHYDNHTTELPDFVLKDAAPARRPVAMYVYGPALGAIKQFQQETAHKQSAQRNGMDFWCWNAALHAQPPPIPSRYTPES